MSYLEKLAKKNDKWNVSDFALFKANLPPGIDEEQAVAAPFCMYVVPQNGDEDNKHIDFDMVRLLFWVMAKRERADITPEEVGEGINRDNIDEIIKEIFYFWTSMTREDINERVEVKQEEANAPANPPEPEETPLP